MSDSDSSDDEQTKKMLEAVDTGFLNNSLFRDSPGVSGTEPAINKTPKPKSQRYLEIGEEAHSTDLQVPEAMQTFLAKKLSEMIGNTYEFVSFPPKIESPKEESEINCLRLLSDSDGPIRLPEECKEHEHTSPRNRLIIQKRIIEEEMIDYKEKLRQACVDSKYIRSGKEVKFWAKRPPRQDKFFEYKRTKGGTLQYVEPENEFTKMRKKNCWSEKRISRDFKKDENEKVCGVKE